MFCHEDGSNREISLDRENRVPPVKKFPSEKVPPLHLRTSGCAHNICTALWRARTTTGGTFFAAQFLKYFLMIWQARVEFLHLEKVIHLVRTPKNIAGVT